MRMVAEVVDLIELEPMNVQVNGRPIAIVRIDDEIFAFAPTCTHRPGPLTAGAVTRKRTVLCPWHLGTFSLRDGRVIAGPPSTRLATYPVVVRNGEVWIDDESSGTCVGGPAQNENFASNG